MTDDDATPGPSAWKTVIAVAGLLVAVAAVAIAATTTYPVTDGATFQTDSGVTVTTGKDINVESGTPFDNSTALTLQNVTFKGSGSASVTVESYQQWLNMSSVDVSSNRMYVADRDGDRRPVGFGDGIAMLRLSPSVNLSQNSTETELVYDAGSNATLQINNTGLADGKGVVAVDTDTGEALDSGIVQSNGNVELTELPTGTHDVNVRVGPSELRVLKERKPTQLVDDAGELRIRFFTDDGSDVVERDITDGTVSFAGLPQDEQFVVTVRANATADYHYRRVIVNSIVDQQEIYLLSTNATAEDVSFALDDQTGEFAPPGTVDLFVEKPINKDFDGDGTNETRYQTMVGDNFGASGEFPAVLREDERYRLNARNNDGDQRVLGSYTVTTGGLQTITIGQIRISGDTQRGTAFGTTIEEVNGDRVIRIQYRDPTQETNSLELEVYEYQNQSNVIRANTTEDGPFGTYTETITVPNNKTDTSWVIRYHANREADDDVGGTNYVGDIPPIAQNWNMDPQVLQLLSLVSIVSIMGLVVILDDRLAAIVGVVTATAFQLLGAINIPMVALGIAGAIAFIYAIARDPA